MEIDELKILWQNYDHKLEKSIALNYKNLEEIQKLKAASALKPATRIKILAIGLGILWELFLAFLIIHSLSFSNLFFVISLGIIFAITAIAIGIYVWHLILIHQIVNSNTVIEAQQKLAILQNSLLKIVRLLWLQLPFFCTWFITPDWIKNSPNTFWFIEVPVILLFTYFGIWLYRNINYKNIHKKWFKILFNSPEWTGIIKSGEFLNEIKEYKKID